MKIPFTFAHGTIRFSLSIYNTEEEVDYVLEVLPGVIKNFVTSRLFRRPIQHHQRQRVVTLDSQGMLTINRKKHKVQEQKPVLYLEGRKLAPWPGAIISIKWQDDCYL